MAYTRTIIVVLLIALLAAGTARADTTVADFEALNPDAQSQKLADLTNTVVDKIAAKNPIRALRIQKYFIIPPPGEKHAVGAVALYHQIEEYDQIDPKSYSIENAFAKVLSDYLVQNAATTQPATQPTTQPCEEKRS